MGLIIPISKHPTFQTSGHTLANARDIEVENVFASSNRFWKYLRGYFKGCELKADYSKPISLYLDTPRLDFHSRGINIRDRQRAVSSQGHQFDDMVALKCCHAELQRAAREIASRIDDGLQTFMPIIVRREIEHKHHRPHDAGELRFDDLPPEVQTYISQDDILGPKAARDVVLARQFLTVTDRNRFHLIFDPRQKQLHTDIAAAKSQFLPVPDDDEERRPGRHICYEVAMDANLTHLEVPAELTIREVLEADANNFRGFKPLQNPVNLVEFEFHAKHSGLDITPADVVRGHLMVQDLFMSMNEKRGVRHHTENLCPMDTKAETGFHLLRKPRRSQKNIVTYSPAPRCLLAGKAL